MSNPAGPSQFGTGLAVTSPSAGVAAGIVTFHPQPEVLLALVDTAAADVRRVFLFLNSAIDDDLRNELVARPSVRLIEAEQNLGIGVGLNFITLAAALEDFEAILLFDQDSQPGPAMIRRLRSAQDDLIAAGENPAVVAPIMISAHADSKPPTYRFRAPKRVIGGARAVDFVPTSGSLFRIEPLLSIGLFRADYFIDGIDVEFSYRAWSRGYSCWILPECPMVHSIGSGVIVSPFLHFRMPLQRPFRMHCMTRNTVYGLRLRHIPFGWKCRQLAYLPLQMLTYAAHHRLNPAVLRLLGSGLLQGLRGQLGVPNEAPDQAKRVAGDEITLDVARPRQW